MKHILSGTVAAFVLGAAIASSQTPPAAQAPPSPAPAQPPAGQAQPAGPPTEQRSAAPRNQGTTYKGILKGSATTGWTLSPIRGGATSTAGATATAGGADAVTYSVVTADGSKVDLASMANQSVEIAGVLAPEAAGKPAAGADAAHRTFTVNTIKTAEGCK